MRHKIERCVSVLAYWLGLDALFYLLNRKAKRILTFHNVLRDDLYRCNLANGVSNRLSDFVAIINECQKHFGFSTNFDDPSTVTITFDDGYRCQYSTAYRYLKTKNIPAYIFIAGEVEAGKGLVIDRILHWVAEVPIAFIPGGDRFAYWTRAIWPRFMADHVGKGAILFKELECQYPYSKILQDLPHEYVNERLGPISPEERAEMRDAGWKIGWHTKFHFPLVDLNDDELEETLRAPSEYAHECFCYPFGNPEEIGIAAISCVEKLGFPSAVSNTNKDADNGSRFFMPRMSFISSDRYEVNFELSGFKFFLKEFRLLPRLCRKAH